MVKRLMKKEMLQSCLPFLQNEYHDNLKGLLYFNVCRNVKLVCVSSSPVHGDDEDTIMYLNVIITARYNVINESCVVVFDDLVIYFRL